METGHSWALYDTVCTADKAYAGTADVRQGQQQSGGREIEIHWL